MMRFRPVAWLAVLFGVFGLGFGADARAWWNGDWAFRKDISFDLTPQGADIAGALADVPILVRLSLANFQYFADANPDGSDLRFVASDDKTPLKFHIERFDPKAQIALVWVRVPRLTAGANTDKIFLYYGNKKAPNGADPAGTYDTNAVLVYHLEAAADRPQDSTAYKTEPKSFKAESNPASLIAGGARFAGSGTISVPATGALRLQSGKGLTISTWARFEQPPAKAVLAELAEQGHTLALGIEGSHLVGRYDAGGKAPVAIQQTGDLAPGTWHHLVLRIGDGRLTLFADGEDVAHADAESKDLGGVLTIGGTSSGTEFYVGDLDEFEVANVARSADWLKAAFRSQGVAAPLVVYGGDTQKEGGGESYFATTLRNVTTDGWVIIAVLSVLFVASFAIMGAKLLYLNRVVSGNARFLDEYRRMGDDPGALERREGPKVDAEADAAAEEGGQSQIMAALTSGREQFGISTLWHLYHHGMQETMKRVQGQSAGAARARGLSPQSIEAIRATMDASLTRLSQRLSAQMVWLTISIAGGPFLGLLGTVVGVMITFAAIAASGDVNVNAIAPGIAAALVATVAGLAVAIPCLFGYNYLNTRIREIVADMRVFVDEFVARIAETYS